MNLQIRHKDYHTYTNWSIKLPEKLGGAPTNLFPEKSLFKIK
jgi:hypothetical protein